MCMIAMLSCYLVGWLFLLILSTTLQCFPCSNIVHMVQLTSERETLFEVSDCVEESGLLLDQHSIDCTITVGGGVINSWTLFIVLGRT